MSDSAIAAIQGLSSATSDRMAEGNCRSDHVVAESRLTNTLEPAAASTASESHAVASSPDKGLSLEGAVAVVQVLPSFLEMNTEAGVAAYTVSGAFGDGVSATSGRAGVLPLDHS